jgi:hypothetical protein
VRADAGGDGRRHGEGEGGGADDERASVGAGRLGHNVGHRQVEDGQLEPGQGAEYTAEPLLLVGAGAAQAAQQGRRTATFNKNELANAARPSLIHRGSYVQSPSATSAN